MDIPTALLPAANARQKLGGAVNGIKLGSWRGVCAANPRVFPVMAGWVGSYRWDVRFKSHTIVVSQVALVIQKEWAGELYRFEPKELVRVRVVCAPRPLIRQIRNAIKIGFCSDTRRHWNQSGITKVVEAAMVICIETSRIIRPRERAGTTTLARDCVTPLEVADLI